MDKEKTANDFYNILNLYTDYINNGFMREHETFNFSYLTKMDDFIAEENVISPKSKINNLPLAEKKRKMIELAENIIKCSECDLCRNCKKVPGAGNVQAKIFVLMYPPTLEEETAGRPLIGKTGDFFKKWMDAINIEYNDLFITNLIKCPIKKVQVTKQHIEICRKHLDSQLEIIQPEIILCLGQLTLSSLKKTFIDIKEAHGNIFYYNDIPFLPTYNPAEVIINTSLKKIVWDDLKTFSKFIDKNYNN